MGGQPLKSSGYDAKASIAIVGLQGAGKRSLGFIAASHLRRRLVLECAHFEEITGLSKASYLRKYGRERFYSKALELLKSMLNDFHEGSILVCGVTSLVPGTTSIIADFSRDHPVIHVRRDLDTIPPKHRSSKAEQLHLSCSNFEYFNLDEIDTGRSITEPELMLFTLKRVRADFERFVTFVTSRTRNDIPGGFDLDALPVEQRSHSLVVALNMSDVLDGKSTQALSEFAEDAIELRVPYWDEATQHSLGHCLAVIRRATESPVLLSLSTIDQMEPGRGNDDLDQAMLYGVRLGVEYIIVRPDQIGDSQSSILENRGSTKIIAHYHFHHETQRAWLADKRIEACIEAQRLGCSAVRLTQDSARRQDNSDVSWFLRKVANSELIPMPVSAYNIGPFSKPSKISNAVLTPVVQSIDRPLEPTFSLQEDITAQDLVRSRFANFEYDALNFWVLGTHVSASLTPTMNQAAYDHYAMPHIFTRHFTPSFDEVLSLAQDSYFGGGAITTPFKEKAYKACVSSSPHAIAIGAVNTILPLRRLEYGKEHNLAEQALQRNKAGPVIGLYGDNSDWYGIYANVKKQLSPRNAAKLSQSTSLVIGAGGSARSAVYALMRCGLHTICIHNRTTENAQRLVDHFRAWGARNGYQTRLETLPSDFQWPEGLQTPTIVASCVPSGTIEMPAKILDSPWGGVVVDQTNSQGQRHWSLVEGGDILLESCVLQFEQMTGYKAPRAVMERALRAVDRTAD
ncbi:hypothetical protein PRZ48_006729 [Zasmidium cellare]|uniref:Quinate repressor protein n=1 Tax=Zasmidium cellare TaxID=395010 RepID=A0ABR0EQA2_ZASCE|nr:hypothetical protein PRZ48_006729 [Zasmidium cellare]